MINNKHKFIFIHIPKTGGHSVDKFFLERSMVDDTKWHCTSNQIMKFIGDETWNSYFSFTIVRNPWDRMVSEYSWQKGSAATQIATPWGNDQVSFKDFLKMVQLSPRNHHDMNQIRAFDTWYRMQEIKDGHLNTQLSFIINDNGEKIIDHVIKFERLNAEFTQTLKKIGLKEESLPHLNKSDRGSYDQYYDQECIDIVAERFKDDIDYFKYDF